MGKHVNIQDDDRNYRKLINNLKKLNGAKLKVGVVGEDDSKRLMIASVHEFGVRIEVTQAMRNFFLAKGYPLRKDTTEINIPERSYIRSTFDENLKKIQRDTERMGTEVIQGRLSAKKFMDKLGNQLVSLVQQTISDLEEPPLHPMTKENRSGKKGGESPLQDTGHLWQSIDYEVEW